MTDRRFGGFWRRLSAYIIDKFVLYLISLILFLAGLLAVGFGGVSVGSTLMTGDLPHGTGLFMAFYIGTLLLIDMIYFIWFHGTVGRTLGKTLFGLRVIRTSGEPMTLGIAFLRWVGSLVSGIPFFLGFIWIAFDSRKQGWHDKIAATLVVRTGNESGAQMRPTGISTSNNPSLTGAEAPSSASPSVLLPPVTADGIVKRPDQPDP